MYKILGTRQSPCCNLPSCRTSLKLIISTSPWWLLQLSREICFCDFGSIGRRETGVPLPLLHALRLAPSFPLSPPLANELIHPSWNFDFLYQIYTRVNRSSGAKFPRDFLVHFQCLCRFPGILGSYSLWLVDWFSCKCSKSNRPKFNEIPPKTQMQWISNDADFTNWNQSSSVKISNSHLMVCALSLWI